MRKIGLRTRTKGVVLLFLLFTLVASAIALYLANNRTTLSSSEADALYGGRSDIVSHPYAGYLMDYSSLFSKQMCGVTFISDTTALSSAHCFLRRGSFFVGEGVISTSLNDNHAVSRIELHPEWNEETLQNDIAIINFENSTKLNRANIGEARIGCDYEVIAYGSTDQRVISNVDLRRRAEVCINSVTEDQLYISSNEGGVCFGDSGSPVFRKGTNELVGIISAIATDNTVYSSENCFINNQAVAVRVESYRGFVESSQAVLASSQECPTGSGEICSGDEVCLSNECRRPGNFLYISALDYRSANYLFGGLSSNALLLIAGIASSVFLLLIVRLFRRSYGGGFY